MARFVGRLAPSSSATTHIIRFSMYNLVGALLPLLISWSVRRIGGTAAPAGAYASELLFFAIMVSATALGDLTDQKSISDGPTFQLIKGALLFGAIVVAAIFGVYQYDVIIGSSNQKVRENITLFAYVLALSLFVTSMVAEMLVARTHGIKQITVTEERKP